MLSEDAITKTDHADDCNPLATRVPGPRITPESVRRNPNAAMNEMHTDVAAAELPTSPRGLTLGVMPGEVVTLLDEGGRIVGLIGVGTIKGDAARLTFDVPADITVVRPMGATGRRVLNADKLATMPASVRRYFTTHCPKCNEEVEYEPGHPAERDTNIAAFPGGFACGCGWELLDAERERPVVMGGQGRRSVYAEDLIDTWTNPGETKPAA